MLCAMGPVNTVGLNVEAQGKLLSPRRRDLRTCGCPRCGQALRLREPREGRVDTQEQEWEPGTEQLGDAMGGH